MNIEDILKKIRETNKKRNFDESLTAHYFFVSKNSKSNNNFALRGFVTFPNAFGKEKKVVVLTDDEKVAQQLRDLGAFKVGGTELVEEIYNKKNIDFDVLITTPSMMSHVSRISKILGPKGLMPNPKNNTVGENLTEMLKMYKSCSQSFKSIDNKMVNIRFGKLSMDDSKLIQNFHHVTETILNECKKFGINSFKRVIIKTTMGKPLSL